MFYLLLPTLEHRTAFIDHLSDHKIKAVFHYLPLNTSQKGREMGGEPGQCPVTERVSDQLVRLPFYNTLDTTTQNRIIECIQEFKVS
jgi:dTDP-4-amino-4,6-dideoxygalactose transaminase